VRWVPIADLGAYDTTDGLADMVHRAERVRRMLASSPAETPVTTHAETRKG